MARYFYRPGHPKASANGFVSEADIGWEPPVEAKNAPIMVDRFYENTKATDGADIGSRRKHKEYMKAHNVTNSGDFSPEWYANKRKEYEREYAKERRETLERAAYNVLERRRG
jgi:hypothetical protein